jgi:hypothetical protein
MTFSFFEIKTDLQLNPPRAVRLNLKVWTHKPVSNKRAFFFFTAIHALSWVMLSNCKTITLAFRNLPGMQTAVMLSHGYHLDGIMISSYCRNAAQVTIAESCINFYSDSVGSPQGKRRS